MSFLNADQILQAEDRRYEEVLTPEWGGKVRIRSLTGQEFEDWQDSLKRDKKGKITTESIRASLAAEVMVNEEGERLFAGTRMVVQLGKKSSAALQRIFTAAQRMNGLNDEDVEELAEGFGEAPDEPSTSD